MWLKLLYFEVRVGGRSREGGREEGRGEKGGSRRREGGVRRRGREGEEGWEGEGGRGGCCANAVHLLLQERMLQLPPRGLACSRHG